KKEKLKLKNLSTKLINIIIKQNATQCHQINDTKIK
ncbi:hypothetical protein FWK35_00023299, partial [Aphis craccivora]